MFCDREWKYYNFIGKHFASDFSGGYIELSSTRRTGIGVMTFLEG